MRVLQMVSSLGSGGIESLVTNLNGCREAFETPFDFLVLDASSKYEVNKDKNIEYGSSIFYLGDNCSSNSVVRFFQKRKREVDFFRENRYDVVHIHGSDVFRIFEVFIAKKTQAGKVIIHSHNTHITDKGIKGFVKLLIHYLCRPIMVRYADEYCACSTEAAKWLYGNRLVEKGSVSIIKNGIDASDYYFNEGIREEYRKRMGWSTEKIIGSVGRFSVQKNPLFIVDVFKGIHEVIPDTKLVMFGEGELKHQVEERIAGHGLQDSVILFGVTNEINNWLQTLDLFLFPSLFEGLPVSGIEAQASGVPILASDTISPELKISECLTWYSLNMDEKEWASKAVSILNTKSHLYTKSEIESAGYDIHSTAKILKELYSR